MGNDDQTLCFVIAALDFSKQAKRLLPLMRFELKLRMNDSLQPSAAIGKGSSNHNEANTMNVNTV